MRTREPGNKTGGKATVKPVRLTIPRAGQSKWYLRQVAINELGGFMGDGDAYKEVATVVRTGGVANAARELRLAQPTISGQLRALEHVLGEKLLERSGRRLVPTDVGRMVFRYADEIFGLGRELQDALEGRPTAGAARLNVGIVDSMPKIVVRQLLEPALCRQQPHRLADPERIALRAAGQGAHQLGVRLCPGRGADQLPERAAAEPA